MALRWTHKENEDTEMTKTIQKFPKTSHNHKVKDAWTK